MKRIRKLGLGVVMALALSAMVGVGSASASAFVVSGPEYPKDPALIFGKATDFTIVQVGATSIYFVCEGYSKGLWAEDVTGPIDTLDHTGTDVACTGHMPLGKTEKATLKANECGTTFHTGPEIATGEFSATVDIAPNLFVSKCGPIRIDSPSCDVLIPEQKGINAKLVNKDNGVSPDSVEASMSEFVQISLENCGGVKATVANFYGRWEPKAFSLAGLPIDLRVVQTGVYTGEEGFEAEGYPAILLGEQSVSDPQQFNFAGRTVKCTNISVEGKASGASTELTLDASYEGCTAVVLGNPNLPTTIAMNSCRYVLGFSGTLGVSCEKEGDAIETKIFSSVKNQEAGLPACVYRIAAQSGVGSVAYSTVGEGNERKIAADLEVTSLTYTKTTGSDLLCAKSPNKVGYTGGLTLGAM